MDYDYEAIYRKLSTGDVVVLRQYRKNSIAKAGREAINIGNLFFDFSPIERECIVYHEISHQKESFWRYRLGRLSKAYRHELEFNADHYAMQMTSREEVVQTLETLKRMIEEGKLNGDYKKTHPPTDERIRRIKNNIKPKHYHP